MFGNIPPFASREMKARIDKLQRQHLADHERIAELEREDQAMKKLREQRTPAAEPAPNAVELVLYSEQHSIDIDTESGLRAAMEALAKKKSA